MKQETPKAPLMERLGLNYFQRLSARIEKRQSADDIHVLNPEEKASLGRLERHAVLRAAAAGALSALVCAIATGLAWPLLGADPEQASWDQSLAFWSVVGGVGLLATLLEVAYLYRDALRTVHAMSVTAGLNLFPTQSEPEAVARNLVRAALEMPNPPDTVQGLNPRREVSRFRMLVATLLYKLKVTLSNFLIKALIRRAMGRTAARSAAQNALLEMVAVPVFGAWDALVCWWVVREARIRALGPSAAEEWVDLLLKTGPVQDTAVQDAMFRAIGAVVVRSVDLHPNYAFLLATLEKKLGRPAPAGIDDSESFLSSLDSLPPQGRDKALQTLALTAALGGSMGWRLKAFIREAMQRTGRRPNLLPLRMIRRSFLSGQEISLETVLAADGIAGGS